ncbi:asparagine synthase (glutamine-hydrolyzing) [Pedobacter aquatilis]|uniref:asparagine synthase (glutamine-hydrolyzing) n=1 Tax=Pedobacter aquatilis TaxID=351343 RepID=UPI00292DFB30|nr:asparagine synthase (glutamine-hydrolyzing) [Pedobacter aquatilis]
MCRIAGIIDNNKTDLQLKRQVKAMCDIMAHGGPDDQGFYVNIKDGIALGHRRLAFIDLSEAGHQPMFYNQDQYVISFNGEIYNYRDVKANLLNLGYEFKSNSDTEVILAAYAAWGVESFSKLKGMFAFSIYDTVLKCSYLVRDSVGIKPLYYSATKERLVFASEAKAFAQTDYHYSENVNWKIYFLAFGHIPEPYTTFNEIEMLPKGFYLVWDHVNFTFEIKEYQTSTESIEITNYDEAVVSVKSALKNAVRQHLYSDAPIGTFLSGGIDSSIISILASGIFKNQSRLQTLSVNFDDADYSEKAFQDLISIQVNSIHHEFTISKSVFDAQFNSAISAMDQPSVDGINSWFISYFANKNGLKAVLSGIGADELFGGYPSFKRMRLVEKLIKLPKFMTRLSLHFNRPALRRAYYLSYNNTCGKYLFLRGIFTPDDISSLLNCPISYVDSVLRSARIGEMDSKLKPTEQASWLEYNLYMQNQLLKDTDAMSMQHGVEVRVPFLDQDLIRIVRQIRSDLIYENKKPKGLLVDAFMSVLPEKIWKRSKMGFTFPFQKWLCSNDAFLNSFQGIENKRAFALVQSFKNGGLHWTKMIAMHHVFAGKEKIEC